MSVNREELAGKTSDELIAMIVDLSEKNDKPADQKPIDPALADKSDKGDKDDKILSDEAKKLSDDNKELKENNKQLSEQVKVLVEKDRLNAIDAKLNEFADKGIPKVVIDMARTICAADKGTNSITLTEKDDKGVEKQITLSFTESILKLAASVPSVQLGENATGTSEGSNEPASDKDLDMVKRYAEEKKIPFRTAMNELTKEGKIKPKTYFHTEG